MRELKGDWKDLFNGFMLALDLRKMFLGFAAILFTLLPLAATAWIANRLDDAAVQRPTSLVLGEVVSTCGQSFHVIYSGTPKAPRDWKIFVPHAAGFLVAVIAIWSFFGGAIARIAAYEIAKDGERLETGRALKFARKKFWSFFMAPFICALGFLFFGFCNFAGGFVGWLLDFIWIGGPLVALLLPLALLSGFIMALILVGTVAGAPLFAPAVAAEGTDAFDAVSRGFSYVYSRPWHYGWYHAVTAAYGVVACSFVICFAFLLCHLGLSAGGVGFDVFLKKAEKDAAKPTYARFSNIADAAWTLILDKNHEDCPCEAKAKPMSMGGRSCPYPWLMHAGHKITGHKASKRLAIGQLPGNHQVAAYIVVLYLVVTMGMALGYLPSYVISQRTMIYYIMRKKVDGIEMNEVFEEAEEEEKPAAPVPPGEGKPSDKPAEPPKA